MTTTLRPLTEREMEIPHTLFIDHVSPPVTIDWPGICPPGTGTCFAIPLSGSATVLDVKTYRRVTVRVGTTQALAAYLSMGKISGSTLSENITVPLDGKPHTYDIVGPEISFCLSGGAGMTKENVQLYLYLTS